MNNPNKTIIVIQARSGSTRFPEKILRTACDKPLLIHMVERVKRAKLADLVVVATTELKSDEKIVKLCSDNDIECYAGEPYDLLDRHYKAGLFYGAETIVKIPSDCPLIDPEIIDNVISFYNGNKEQYDYVSNLHPPTYPDGNDVEVMSMKALETSWKESIYNYEREHTTPYIWDNPNKFEIGNYFWETTLNYSDSHRFTLDYIEDYEFILNIFENLYYEKPEFTLYDILWLLKEDPGLMEINSKHIGYNWYIKYRDRLKTFKQNLAYV